MVLKKYIPTKMFTINAFSWVVHRKYYENAPYTFEALDPVVNLEYLVNRATGGKLNKIVNESIKREKI